MDGNDVYHGYVFTGEERGMTGRQLCKSGKGTQSESWAMDGGGKKKDVEDKLYRLLSLSL